MAVPMVFIGGDSGIDQLISNPNKWDYVRKNADGFYVNNAWLPLKPDPNAGSYLVNEPALRAIANLFRNKAAFYETDGVHDWSDLIYPGEPPDDDPTRPGDYYHKDREYKDKRRLDYLKLYFNNIPYAILFTPHALTSEKLNSRLNSGLQHNQPRTVMVGIGSCLIDGDIQNGTGTPGEPEAHLLAYIARCGMDMCYGMGTDGPMGHWARNETKMHEGSYSIVRHARDRNKTSMVMLAPINFWDAIGAPPNPPRGNTRKYLKSGQDCVRKHEDHDAIPNIWAVSYYAATEQVHAVVPESVSSVAAPTITGMAYWLLHHIHDPHRWSRLSVASTNNIVVKMSKFDLETHGLSLSPELVALPDEVTEVDVVIPAPRAQQQSVASQMIEIAVHNASEWLDLCPVLSVKKIPTAESGKAWGVRCAIGRKDVTDTLTGEHGLKFVGELRLWPGYTRTLQIFLSHPNVTNITPDQVMELQIRLTPYPGATERLHELLILRVRVERG